MNILKITFVSAVVFASLISNTSIAKSILDGAIPECKELLSPERAKYRQTAEVDCKKVRTTNEEMNNVGCLIRAKFFSCGVASGAAKDLNDFRQAPVK
jgi:hypothetical protein